MTICPTCFGVGLKRRMGPYGPYFDQNGRPCPDCRPLPKDDPRHGTVNGYVNRECRCADCRAAWADYQRGHEKKWRAKNYAEGKNARGKPYKRPAR